MREERIFREVKELKKIVLTFRPSDGGCSNLETKRDRRKAPRANLLV
jgi:hypothetical protein